MWVRRAPERAPEVGEVRGEADKDGTVALRWSYWVATEEPETWVQWSPDGEHWRGLIVGLSGSEPSLPVEGLPAGPVQLRVLVHDGFSTAVSDPVEIEVPERGPVAAILHPRDGQTLLAGRPMQLWAAATDQADEPLDDERVGSGAEVWVTAPPPGEHEVVLTVVGPGEDARVTVRFTTVGNEGNDDEKTRRAQAR